MNDISTFDAHYKVVTKNDVISFDLPSSLLVTEEEVLEEFKKTTHDEFISWFANEGDAQVVSLFMDIIQTVTIPDSLKEFYLKYGECDIQVMDKITFSIYSPEKFRSFYKHAIHAYAHGYKHTFYSECLNSFYPQSTENKDQKINFTNLYVIGEVVEKDEYLLMDLNAESAQYGYLYIWAVPRSMGDMYPEGYLTEYPAFMCKSMHEFVTLFNGRKFWRLQEYKDRPEDFSGEPGT